MTLTAENNGTVTELRDGIAVAIYLLFTLFMFAINETNGKEILKKRKEKKKETLHSENLGEALPAPMKLYTHVNCNSIVCFSGIQLYFLYLYSTVRKTHNPIEW